MSQNTITFLETAESFRKIKPVVKCVEISPGYGVHYKAPTVSQVNFLYKAGEDIEKASQGLYGLVCNSAGDSIFESAAQFMECFKISEIEKLVDALTSDEDIIAGKSSKPKTRRNRRRKNRRG